MSFHADPSSELAPLSELREAWRAWHYVALAAGMALIAGAMLL